MGNDHQVETPQICVKAENAVNKSVTFSSKDKSVSSEISVEEEKEEEGSSNVRFRMKDKSITLPKWVVKKYGEADHGATAHNFEDTCEHIENMATTAEAKQILKVTFAPFKEEQQRKEKQQGGAEDLFLQEEGMLPSKTNAAQATGTLKNSGFAEYVGDTRNHLKQATGGHE